MKIYSVRTTVQSEEAIVDFSREVDTVSGYLIHGRGSLASMNLPLQAIAQAGYTRSNITTTDYITASIRVPIFSTRFCDALGERLSGELEFIPCIVECEGQAFEFHAGRVLKSLPLVDTEKSEYRKLASGSSLLMRAVYRTSFESSFLISRDVGSRARFVVSEEFKALCEVNALNIEFGLPV
jgi:hypothetical protein